MTRVNSLWPNDAIILFTGSGNGLFSSRPGQNGCHFADDIFKCIFMNEMLCILIQISLKFVPKGRIVSKWALVQIMA